MTEPNAKRGRVDDDVAPLFKWTPSTERAAELKAGFDEDGWVPSSNSFKMRESLRKRQDLAASTPYLISTLSLQACASPAGAE